ncbi:hypothetical protein [Chitinophaga sp. sic0106]|uniref:hypothetical protein n=1 Tax=Chitinophaga sp. sic0106 TaxID=2854785 RepID=UPI001C453085|nr:hypothetical protein [Chitinophaga sp. sic0106]MBV7532851.1 hypothetical protein [Chitinophaga sp. sic0106]
MSKFLHFLFVTILFIKCGPSEKGSNEPSGKQISVTHFNILFVPDMSNRVNPGLYQRPLADMDILSVITQNLYPTILRFKRAENQQDKLMIDFVNKGLINQYGVNTDKLLIDFSRFANQNDRINYIAEREGVNRTLRSDINEMSLEYSRINNLAIKQNTGADIWSYFHQGIDEKRVLPVSKPLIYMNNRYVNSYRNILILLTDGYIEAGIFNKGFDLSKKSIDMFRKAFLQSGESDMGLFLQRNKQFQIKPVNNQLLQNLEVLVMELYDRSLSPAGVATIHPTDMEIIRLFWTNWLQNSKVKRFELHSYATSKDEAEKTVLHFLGISKT